MFLSMWERKKSVYVIVCMWKRQRDSVCVWVWDKGDGGRECVCVRKREREREREMTSTLWFSHIMWRRHSRRRWRLKSPLELKLFFFCVSEKKFLWNFSKKCWRKLLFLYFKTVTFVTSKCVHVLQYLLVLSWKEIAWK